jgi:hypothetical protein
MKVLVLLISCLIALSANAERDHHNDSGHNHGADRTINIDPNVIIDFARRGDVMGNGGGLAEQNIIYAYGNITTFIDICLDSNDCRLDDKEKDILKKIKANMHREYVQGQIVFKSERAEPGTFLLHGEPKIAKTWLYVEAPIYINKDLLYQTNTAGKVVPLDLSKAVAIMIHELGHHHNINDHTMLDLLGVKVSMAVGRDLEKARVLPGYQNLQATVITKMGTHTKPTVLLYVGDQIFDISKVVADELHCTSITIPIFGSIQFGNAKPVGSILHNIAFTKQDISDVANDSYFTLTGSLVHFCKDGSKLRQITNTKLDINFSAQLYNDTSGFSWKYNSSSLGVKQYKESLMKLFFIPLF